MPNLIDLNADLGEGVTDDAALLKIVTSANVACGYHAGDRFIMESVCQMAAERGVAIGAQVSYRDREGFGRREMDVEVSVLSAHVADQIETLSRIAERVGTVVSYVRPHGALYNRIVRDPEQAEAVLDGSGDLPVMGLRGSVVLELAAQRGRACRLEGFPDRGYAEDGSLLPRSHPGALVVDTEEIAQRAVALAAGVDSLCLHGDSPGAVVAALAVREALERNGFLLRAPDHRER